MDNCEHKYVLKSTTSYWYFSGRNYVNYVYIDVFFCEKCLDETERKKTHDCLANNKYDLPDWARGITYHAKHLDANYY